MDFDPPNGTPPQTEPRGKHVDLAAVAPDAQYASHTEPAPKLKAGTGFGSGLYHLVFHGGFPLTPQKKGNITWVCPKKHGHVYSMTG